MTEEDLMKCNCADEFAIAACPVHPAGHTKEAFRFADEEKTLIIDDSMMHEDMWAKFQGWIFNCPSCKTPSIMVNKDFGHRCFYCGAKVQVNSKIVTDYVRLGIIPQKLQRK